MTVSSELFRYMLSTLDAYTEAYQRLDSVTYGSVMAKKNLGNLINEITKKLVETGGQVR